MIQIKNLQFAYNSQNSFVYPDSVFNDNEQWLIRGESGCGKTTFLHLLAGMLTPTAGNIFINKLDINGLNASEIDKYRGREIGIVFQKHHFVKSLNVSENLSLSAWLSGKQVDKHEIKQLLDRLNITHKQHAKMNELSQGELQRLSIARAVLNQPSVILADEPTSSLDDKHCMEVIELLRSVAHSNQSLLIVVSHDERLSSFFGKQLQLHQAKQ